MGDQSPSGPQPPAWQGATVLVAPDGETALRLIQSHSAVRDDITRARDLAIAAETEIVRALVIAARELRRAVEE